MAWREMEPMDERIRFVLKATREEITEELLYDPANDRAVEAILLLIPRCIAPL
jgi:hypothetical protein